jgi:hypothetical protein
MRLLPAPRIITVGILVLLLAIILYIPIQQHLLRNRAERLHAEILALQLHPGTFADVQRMQKTWGAYAHYDGPCTQRHCIYSITLKDLFLWWTNKHPGDGEHSLFPIGVFKAYAFFGGHPTQVGATIRVRDNRMWGADFAVEVFTYPGTGRNEGQVYAVLVGINSGTRLFRRHEFIRTDLLSKGFRTTAELQCLGCQVVDVNLTHQTDPKDIERFNRLDLSCITRWHPCKHPQEMAPELWMQALHDKPVEDRLHENDPEVCTLSPSILAREANDIALVKVLSVEAIRDSDTTQVSQRATVQILQLLKNGRSYPTTDPPGFAVPPGSIRPEAGKNPAQPIEGKEYLFLYREPRPNEIDNFLYLEPCHGILASPENSALVHQGIALDPSAGEPYDYWNQP